MEGSSVTSATHGNLNYRGAHSVMWGSFLPPLIWQEIHSQQLTQHIHKVLLKLLKIHLNFLYNSWCGFTINENKVVHALVIGTVMDFVSFFNICEAR